MIPMFEYAARTCTVYCKKLKQNLQFADQNSWLMLHLLYTCACMNMYPLNNEKYGHIHVCTCNLLTVFCRNTILNPRFIQSFQMMNKESFVRLLTTGKNHFHTETPCCMIFFFFKKNHLSYLALVTEGGGGGGGRKRKRNMHYWSIHSWSVTHQGLESMPK